MTDFFLFNKMLVLSPERETSFNVSVLRHRNQRTVNKLHSDDNILKDDESFLCHHEPTKQYCETGRSSWVYRSHNYKRAL